MLPALACALGAGTSAEGSGRSAAADAAVAIPLERYQGRLRAVRLRPAGAGAAEREWRLLFDTGAGLTLLSPALATALGCEPRGRVVGHRMTGEAIATPACVVGPLAMGPWTVPAQTVGIFDLMSLLPADWPRLDGVVSLRAFPGRVITLDLAHDSLRVHAGSIGLGAHAREPSRGAIRGTPVLGRLATGPSGAELLAYVGLLAGPDTLWLLVDSGNLDAVVLAPHAARLLGLPDSLDASLPRTRLPLTSALAAEVPTRIRDLILDGAWNAAWLEQGRLTLDLATGAAWWAPHPK